VISVLTERLASLTQCAEDLLNATADAIPDIEVPEHARRFSRAHHEQRIGLAGSLELRAILWRQ
jgi:hypothetical protein